MSNASTFIDIYTNLGYLFYSVAAGDGKVRPAEAERLKALVKEKWLPLEASRDEFGTDAAHYIGMSFDFARSEAMDGDAAFQRFAEEYRGQAARFDDGLKRMVLGTAKAISEAFSGTNKVELARLDALGKLLGR
jgi:hypothetical protein